MKKKRIQIVLAYANDSRDLVLIVDKLIVKLNRVFDGLLTCDLKKWDDVPPQAGIVERTVLRDLRIDEADIFIGVFRYTYGNPTGMKRRDGNDYMSGLEQECEIAFESYKNHGYPEVLLFKSEEAIPRDYIANAADNLEKIDKFFKKCKTYGEYPCLFKTFTSTGEFETNVLDALTYAIFRRSISSYNTSEKYKEIYFADDNDERNKNKRERISRAGIIRLSAKSCYNFLNQQGCFRGELIKRLEEGASVNVIMQNPFSFNSLVAALGFKTLNAYYKRKIDINGLMEEYYNSNWYKQRFMGSIEGYNDLRKVSKKICLRLTETDLSTSILLTDEVCYFEPYLNSIEVGKKPLSIFEVEADNKTELYKDSENDFDSIWKNGSVSYSEYKKKMELYKERLRIYLEGLIENGKSVS